jgi:hypothetical protein
VIVKYSPRAIADQNAIDAYVAERSPSGAVRVL